MTAPLLSPTTIVGLLRLRSKNSNVINETSYIDKTVTMRIVNVIMIIVIVIVIIITIIIIIIVSLIIIIMIIIIAKVIIIVRMGNH